MELNENAGVSGKAIFIKPFFLIMQIAIIIIAFNTQINNKKQEQNYKYFFCFLAMGKGENIYAREVMDYYKNLGVDKFYIADNNNNDTEGFSEIYKKEISDGLVEILNFRGRKKDQTQLYGEMYQMYKHECKWLSFLDFDEFLVLKKNGKNMTVHEYLSDPNFEKCDVVLINWIMYSDNNMVRYINKTMNERFTKPLYYSHANRFVKTIMRGNFKWNPWGYSVTPHRPQAHKKTCDCYGKRAKTFNDVLKPPRIKDIYIKHFGIRTAEEYIAKVKRGHPGNLVLFYDERIDNFFHFNQVTEEKVRFFEKELNRTFPKYHYIFSNKSY